jgi:hypothetical protein
MAGLLENIDKFKHVYKTLDAMREASGILHADALEMGESIDSAITLDKIADEVFEILEEKVEKTEKIDPVQISNAVTVLKESASKLQSILDKHSVKRPG